MPWNWLDGTKALQLEELWQYPATSARTLVELGVRAGLLLLVATLLSLLLRRDDATVRHRLWRITLVATLVLPLVSLVAPRWQVPIVPIEVVAPTVPMRMPAMAGDPLEPSTLMLQTVPESLDSRVAASPITDIGLLSGEIGRAVVIAWPAGTALCLLWILLGFVRLQLLVRRGVESAPHSRAAGLLAARIGLRRRPRVRLSDAVPAPIAFGLLRPVVLLPSTARAWSEERLRVVLLHELTHVRRRDGVHQLVGLVARAFYWPIPFAWTALTELARERELACDEQVVDSGERPSDYASHLLAVARQVRPPEPAMAMAAPGRLEERVLSILRPERPRGAFAASVVVALTLLLTLPVLAGVDPWSTEESTPIASDGRVEGWSDSYLRKELDHGNALMAANDWPRVIDHYRHVLRHTTDVPVAWFRLGYGLMVTGDTESGLEASLRASRYTGFRAPALYNVACAYMLLGEQDLALRAFELSVDGGLRHTAARIRQDPDLETLHGHPRFEEAISKLNPS